MLDTIDLNLSESGVVLGQTRLASNISVLLKNGYDPVARTNKVTPRDQTSLAVEVPYSCERIASGAR